MKQPPSAQTDTGSRLAGVYPALPQDARPLSMPPIHRASMRPVQLDRSLGHRAREGWRFLRRGLAVLSGRKSALRTSAFLRQCCLLLLVTAPALGATAYMATVLPHKGSTALEVAILLSAFLLFAWILVGFWTAMLGFWVLLVGDRYALPGANTPPQPVPKDVRTAVVMPICEEDVPRTFAGLRCVYESLQARDGIADQFDFFVLSDSADPDCCVDEERAWADTCQALDAFGRIFYRRRSARIKRKSGNIADFCRRWGRDYRYMIVLDADSIMTGEALTRLVGLMEYKPDAGIIQSPPVAVNLHSPLPRIQQFATKVYGPMFCAGLHFWHLDNAHYWGHNAIIRIAPFMRHCGLSRLPGSGAMGGEILSHDFVEAALMRRAGWGVYLAYDLAGSYEELPPTLLDELRRDRRWCQGNLQHMRLLFSDRIAPAHRALFANGVMAYASALLWFVFLLLSSGEVVIEALRPPNYFPEAGALFPSWPVWQPVWAISLFAATMVVLFLPKLLGALRILGRGEASAYGGGGALAASALAEVVLTTIIAPIRMLSHTRFVVTTLAGRSVRWTTQQRADAGTSWPHAWRYHGPGVAFATFWGGVIYWANPAFLPWLAPILLSLLLAPAISVYTSRPALGRALRRMRVAMTPEEHDSPPILCRLQKLLDASGSHRPAGFAAAALDPVTNALRCRLLPARRKTPAAIQLQRDELRRLAFSQGPAALSAADKHQLLADREQMLRLHHDLRAASPRPAAWREATQKSLQSRR